MKTHYEITGEGKPIIFIHGAFISSQMWNPQILHFSKNYRVITYDLRGHGLTGPSAPDNYSIELFVSDLKNLIDEIIPGQKPIVCGLSLGGMIAQAYAVKYKNDINCLILCDTLATLSLSTTNKIMYRLFPKSMVVLFLRLLGVKTFIKFAYWMAGNLKGKKWLKNKKIIKYTKQEMLNQQAEEWLKTMKAVYDLKKPDLKEIKAPTLILLGEYEGKPFYNNAALLLNEIQGAKIKIISDAGHLPNLENPREFNNTVSPFIKDACP